MQDVRRTDKPANETPIEEDGHGYHANSFMAVPINQSINQSKGQAGRPRPRKRWERPANPITKHTKEHT